MSFGQIKNKCNYRIKPVDIRRSRTEVRSRVRFPRGT